jgi:hypothetical protein
MNYTIKISDFLSDLADVLSGNYNHKDSELNELREDIFDISVTPNSCDDKEVLKEDLNTFLKDTRKSYKSLKEEVLDGQAE